MPNIIIKQKHGMIAVFLCAFRKEISYDPRATNTTHIHYTSFTITNRYGFRYF